MTPVAGSLSHTWDTWVEFWTLAFGLSQPCGLQAFREWPIRWEISVCLSIFICLSFFVFQINVFLERRKRCHSLSFSVIAQLTAQTRGRVSMYEKAAAYKPKRLPSDNDLSALDPGLASLQICGKCISVILASPAYRILIWHLNPMDS